MNEQAGILNAIVANPDDATNRLVYADWLEDHDQGLLAQFIRAQCACEPFMLDSEEGARHPVGIDVMSLQPGLRPGLLAPFRAVGEELCGAGDTPSASLAVLEKKVSFWVHRGLVEEIEVHGGKAAAAFVRHAKKIFTQAPLLRLTIVDFASRQEFRQHWDGPREHVALPTVRSLVNKVEIARLRSLDLRRLYLGNALGRALLRCRHPFQPQRLALDGNHIEEVVAEPLRQRFGKALVLTPYDPDDIPF